VRLLGGPAEQIDGGQRRAEGEALGGLVELPSEP
jgi:hypothetical protein